MEGGERTEDVSLPSEYVSLAKLQERWLLRKQEERKLKQKQEEEEEDKRVRESWAPRQIENETAGGYAKATGQIEDKGKGKEIVGGGGGPRTGGEIIKKRKNRGKKGKRRFKEATAVEVKEKAGVQAEVLSAGGVGISSGVEEVGNVFEVLPTNREITHLKRTGLKNNGRNRDKGSRRVNELKQSEVALDLEGDKRKEKEGEHDREIEGEREKGRGRDRGRNRGRNGGGVSNLKQSEVALDLEKDKEKEGEIDRGTKWRERGRNGGRVNNLKQSEVALDLEKRKEKGENGHGMKWGERGRGRDGERGTEKRAERGINGDYPGRRMNRKEYRHVGLEGNQVDSKLENQAEDGIYEVCSEISSLNVGDENGLRGADNNAKEDGVEGEFLNGDKVVVKIEKKVKNEVLARKGESFGMRYRTDGNPRGGFGKRYWTNGNPGGGYGRGRGYRRSHISDRMNFTESVKVWVKKDDKLDA